MLRLFGLKSTQFFKMRKRNAIAYLIKLPSKNYFTCGRKLLFKKI